MDVVGKRTNNEKIGTTVAEVVPNGEMWVASLHAYAIGLQRYAQPRPQCES